MGVPGGGSFWGNSGTPMGSVYRPLGPIYSYGHANPLGPHYGLPGAAEAMASIGRPQPPVPATTGTSGSSTSGASGPTSGAETFLNGVMSGNTLPFSPEQQAGQMSSASDMTSAAEAARNNASTAIAQAGGASANDPSMQAARMNSMAKRQSDNTKAKQDITTRADSTNFAARMDAAGQLNSNAMNRESFAHQQQNQAENRSSAYMPWSGGGGGGGYVPHGNNFGGVTGNTTMMGFNPNSYAGEHGQQNMDAWGSDVAHGRGQYANQDDKNWANRTGPYGGMSPPIMPTRR